MNSRVAQLADQALNDTPLARDDIVYLFSLRGEALYDLFYWANRIRLKFKGRRVDSCAILSAKQGRCAEDCGFCSQSAHHRTEVQTFALKRVEEIVEASRLAAANAARSFGIVTSGKSLDGEAEWAAVAEAVRQCQVAGVRCCASLGTLLPPQARRLAEAGLQRYHHNLETSEGFFPRVCTTHSYADRLATLRAARDAGLELCSGGIFGLGETAEDRADLVMTLKGLGVASIPINFLNPIPGTPMGDRPTLPPLEALSIVAAYRFAFPTADIKVCGGREVTLRDLQSWMFYAGANGTMIGNYLTTVGRPAQKDMEMISDLELELDR